MDVDPAEIGKNQTTSVAVVGDVRTSLRIFGKLLMDKAVRASDDNPWLKHVKETKQYWRGPCIYTSSRGMLLKGLP